MAGVWSEKGQVEIYALRRLLQVVDDPQALVTFLRDEQARMKPIFTFAGHMGEGFALDWSPRVLGESWGEYLVLGGGRELWPSGTRWFPDCLPQGAC